MEWMKSQIKEAIQLNQEGASPDLLWDTIKYRIRDLTLHFLKKDRDKDKLTYESFQTRLASLYVHRDSTLDPLTRSTLNEEIIQVTQEWTEFTDRLDAKRLEFNIGRKGSSKKNLLNISLESIMPSQVAAICYLTRGGTCVTLMQVFYRSAMTSTPPFTTRSHR